MAKDTPLPYFKFVIADWNMGDITQCSLSAQGLFINLCAMYWSKRGDLSFAKAVKKFPRKLKHFNELLDEGIIKLNEDQIEISFLSEQLEELGAVSVVNSNNAKSRWNKRKQDAAALQSESDGTADLCHIEEEQEKKRKEQEQNGGAYAGEQKMLSLEVATKCKDITESICRYFSVKPIVRSKLYDSVCDYVNTLAHRNELDIGSLALQNYMKYKARSQETIHSITSWIGTKPEYYRDGKWIETDWDLKNKNYNGQRNTTKGGNGQISPEPGKDYKSQGGF
jgi:hypothetical protein